MMSLGISSLMALLLASSAQSNLVNQAAAPFRVQSFAPVDTQGQPIITPDPTNEVNFDNCPAGAYKVHGQVSTMTITPCQRAESSDQCVFVEGRNYTIQFIFETSLESDHPRSSVVASDCEGTYAYSGQSFSGCNYTTCPIHANQRSAYTYHFHTLKSSFNYLTFNLTQSIDGPSILCAGARITFEP
ncbi:hypothetical protein PCANC_17428 [Puccinia coronata f. sp. avenae]|uniref:Phosphatidylglycerol/phosphatidylinositol transfer protein n=1 Tax=Puccinia coronata f. sp. avenae TaxID=200324 RepID=A0A2N5VD63_9BASI|nr:hypothetical protein PCANC_21457 [Puccinia coronata f. sp. avenae]PLW17708.1 hypothetical protein PCASD_18680 [Puccinia coronata f. sp. avenae]PLW41585.1 hypothetical protein PCANC_17428 [Puccinia coronata f. sp. avenae]PLW47917.1 hypothetical protein PCASD_04942 [Puccinia coronata f. sp. avenae]